STGSSAGGRGSRSQRSPRSRLPGRGPRRPAPPQSRRATGSWAVRGLAAPRYDALNAAPDNPVYAQVAAPPPGRLLELPALPPDAYAGSVYLYYAMQAPRERPLGYATSAPPEAFRAVHRPPEEL